MSRAVCIQRGAGHCPSCASDGSHGGVQIRPEPAEVVPVEFFPGAGSISPLAAAQIQLRAARTLVVSTATDPAVLTRLVSAIIILGVRCRKGHRWGKARCSRHDRKCGDALRCVLRA